MNLAVSKQRNSTMRPMILPGHCVPQERPHEHVDAEPLQTGEEVFGIGTSDVESDVEVDAAVPGGELLEALAELGVAVGRFGELEFGPSLLQLLVEEGGVVAIAWGVDADADGGDQRIKQG